MARVKSKPKPAMSAKKHPPRKGPFLAVAVIVERVLAEPDNVTSLIRLVDIVGIDSDQAEVAAKSGDALIPLTIFLGFKAGGFKGSSILAIIQGSPSGHSVPLGMATAEFDGTENGGVNLKATVRVKWEGEGNYWFDVMLDNNFCTRIPLKLRLSPSQAEEGEK